LSADCTLFGDAGLGLAVHGPVQSVPVWHSLVRRFICEFQVMSHILVPNTGKECCLRSSIYGFVECSQQEWDVNSAAVLVTKEQHFTKEGRFGMFSIH
jgi:hypothetical protein